MHEAPLPLPEYPSGWDFGLWRQSDQNWNLSSATHWLCKLRKVTSAFSFIFLFYKLGLITPTSCVVRIKLYKTFQVFWLLTCLYQMVHSSVLLIILWDISSSCSVSGFTGHALGSDLTSQDAFFQEILNPESGRMWGSHCLGCCPICKSLLSFLEHRNLIYRSQAPESSQFCASGPLKSDSLWAWQFDIDYVYRHVDMCKRDYG